MGDIESHLPFRPNRLRAHCTPASQSIECRQYFATSITELFKLCATALR